jgi:inosine/xanthosine triphosphatase
VKLAAVQEVARQLFGGASVTGQPVESGVGTQPMSDEEAIRGARTRAEAVRRTGCIAIGIEAGVSSVEGCWYGCTWVVVLGDRGEAAIASSARYPIPETLVASLEKGEALGDALRRLQASADGAVDVLTGGRVTRRHLTIQALRLALASLRDAGTLAPTVKRRPRRSEDR